jgi:predicted DNA-binding transcriptional regulator YafY
VPTAASKLQRWIDLLAALLVRRYPATFDELAADIPAYSGKKKADASLMRMFERDKDELRVFGIPIETVTNDQGETLGYKLSSKDFYLPYLALAEMGRTVSKPKKVDKYGYQALSTLTFEPDELAVLSSAIARVTQLGDPVLRLDAESVGRKLAFDLPLGAIVATDGTTRMPSRTQPSAELFDQLNDALLRRKKVSFTYRGIESGFAKDRSIEPYGLFFLSSHWYLAGSDADSREVRNFRLSRIERLTVNSRRAQTPDYEIPPTFSLREHARSRLPWEIGDGDLVEAIVRFPRRTGASSSAAMLGEQIPGESGLRRFRIRRGDAFARWLLSFGGDAVPIAPPAVVKEFVRQIEVTRSLYDRGNRNRGV